MRHVKRYKELFEARTELTPEQIKWLDECTRFGNWTLNPQTGLVDVSGDFDCSSQNLTDFKGVRFGVVTEHFYCSRNKLTSLEGAPQEVGVDFNCSSNELTYLKDAPQEVGGDFDCSSNELTSLKDAPQKVGRGFYCFSNALTSLKDAPQEVDGDFDCSYNQLTSLKDAPQEVVVSFDCSFNKLTSLKDAPQEVRGSFYCSGNELTSLEGAPQKVERGFYCFSNPVSESVLQALYKKMQSGMSWPDAVVTEWDSIESGEDKAMLAPYNRTLSSDELKGYQALARLKRRSI